MREDHYASLASRKFISLEKARSKMLQVDWKANVPMKPKMLGTKTYTDFPLAELLPYIDWNPFFQVFTQSPMQMPNAQRLMHNAQCTMRNAQPIHKAQLCTKRDTPMPQCP